MVSSTRRSRRVAAWLVVAVAVVPVGACGATSEDVGNRMSVVATTTILGDVVANIVGDDAQVEVLMPEAVDPHDFVPSAAQVAAIIEADLVVANGLELEAGMEDVLIAAAGDGVAVFEVAPQLDPIPFAHEDEDEDDDDHDHGALDPHVWFDPTRMATAARLIADELAAVDGSVNWSERADRYAAELEALDEEIVQLLAPIPDDRRRLVTSHESLGYFADRYGFEVIGTIIPGGSTLGDPSSGELADLVAAMEENDVTAIFTETTQSVALAEAIAAELGTAVEVVSLYTGSLGAPESRADTLIGMLRTNAERIAAALTG